MLISLEWLSEFLDIHDLKPDQLAALLTGIGHEVEGWTSLDPVPESVIVGKILSTSPHPDADKLQLCQIDVGHDSPLEIVCGAPNARAELHVAVATIGTTLPNGMTIKPAKIRGQASSGMLCSEKELGLGAQDEGIMELPSSAVPGTRIESLFPRKDTILDISLTPNRGDCLSYLGIARDLAAKLGKTLHIPDSTLQTSATLDASMIRLQVDADASCGRITALHLEDVPAIPAPYWMRRRLTSSGIKSLNLAVDVTNYVLLETGQPVHAYDRRSLKDGSLHVRSARLNDQLQSLDGQDLTLLPGDLLVCDGDRPVALAGIMGGAESGVRPDSHSLVIEVAHFSPAQIRKTARRLSLHTEASHRFERGIDLEAIPAVSQRVGCLLQQCAKEAGLPAVKAATETADWYPSPVSPKRIALRLKRCRTLLGLSRLSIETCIQHLEALGLQLLDKTSERMLFEVPSFRHDLNREVDLIEEVGRIEGFEKIPYELPRLTILASKEAPAIQFAERLRAALATLAMNETISFPFHSPADYEKMGLHKEHPLWPEVALENPLSEEMGHLCASKIPSLLRAALHNRHHGQKGSRLFEMGRLFFPAESRIIETEKFPYCQQIRQMGEHLTAKARKEKNRINERNVLAGLCDHPFIHQSWQQQEEAPAFFHGKELLVRLLTLFGINHCQWQKPENPAEIPWIHPGASAYLWGSDMILGYMGELHPATATAWGIRGESAFVFELDLDALLIHSQQPFQPDASLVRFPPVLRDLALVADESLSWDSLRKTIADFPDKTHLSHQMELFDIYRGPGIPEGKKSLAVSLVFSCKDKTLTEKEIEKEIGQLLVWLQKQQGVVLR